MISEQRKINILNGIKGEAGRQRDSCAQTGSEQVRVGAPGKPTVSGSGPGTLFIELL